MGFDDWLNRAWDEHAQDAAGVADRIEAEGPSLAASDAEVAALMRLAHHVCGDHLARIDAGRALLRRLGTLPAAGEAARSGLRLLDASLALTGGDESRAGLVASERIRVAALAASNLSGRDAVRAGALLREAVSEAEAAALADDDPAVRALAVTGNNVAAALEEKAERSDAERALMLLAAETGRRFWARAGTWLEVERAEYRLSRSHAAAGDAAGARRHALECLRIVAANGAAPLEVFFGQEALAWAERAAGNSVACATAVAAADAAFAQIEESDRTWCRPTLDKLHTS
jgi:hypothetical protein